MFYFVEHNGKFVGMRKTIKGALNFVNRTGFVNDADNTVRIFDKDGNTYNTITGQEITPDYIKNIRNYNKERRATP